MHPNDLEFTWDPRKDATNRRKHGVSSVEAMTAFADPLSLTIPDPDHSAEEYRFVLIGFSLRGRLLVVAHAEPKHQIRIIHARTAARREHHVYQEKRW